MIVKLTLSLKRSLLEAIQSGEIDTNIFNQAERQEAKIEDIEAEIIRLEKLSYNSSGLLMLSELMRRYALKEISETEYIKSRIELCKNPKKEQS